MTIQLDTGKSTKYNGNGTTKAYSTLFGVFETSVVTVYVNKVLKTVNVDYTLTGIGNVSGVVTFTNAPLYGDAIEIERAPFMERITNAPNIVVYLDNFTELRAYVPNKLGESNFIVIAGSLFKWDVENSDPDNGSTVIKTNSNVGGRWVLVSSAEPQDTIYSFTPSGTFSNGVTVIADSATTNINLHANAGINIDGDNVNKQINLQLTKGGLVNTAVTSSDSVLAFDATAFDSPIYRSFANVVTDLGIVTNTGTADLGAGTAGLPALTFAGDTTSGFYRPSTNNVAFTAGGTLVATLNNSGIVMSGAAKLRETVTTGIVAAGTTQGTATGLTSTVNLILTATGADGVRMPTASVGMKIVIINSSGAACKIWPATGAGINGGTANAADTNDLAAGASRTYYAVTTTSWRGA